MSLLSAKVKSVLSGDTLILTPPNKPDQERSLSLAYVTAPRLNSGEPYGFESREYLRTLLVGKPVRFKVLYDINGREYGDVSAPIFNSLIAKSLADGNCKLRDDAVNKAGFEEALGDELLQAEKSAKDSGKGLWGKDLKSIDVQSLVPDVKDDGKQYEAVIERVISGDRLQVRVFLNKKSHFVGPALIAGIKAPRSKSPDTPAEPFGEEAKQFVATRLLQRNIGVKFLGTSSSGIAIVQVVHPAGDIAQLLLTNGLASIADWQSQYLGAAKMSGLRSSEKQAKDSKLNLWRGNASGTASTTAVGGGAAQGQKKGPKSYEAVIAKVISPDTYVVRTPSGEETVQLASVRAPRKNDATAGPYVPLAKEFARSKFIAKKVLVTVEAVRPKSEQFEERALVTIALQEKNIAFPLIQNGWATVIRHRKDDDNDRSPVWDELLEAETEAIKANKGIHSKKPAPPVERVVEASDNVTKARGFLSSLQRQSKINAIVEHVPSGGRLRLSVPKENCNLALVLAGIRVPKPSEECGETALSFVSQRLYQRDVHVTVQNVDKTGAFIGNVFLPGKGTPLSLALVKEGLAEVHEFSAQQSGYEQELYQMEDEAKAARRGIWKDFKDEDEPLSVAQREQGTIPAASSSGKPIGENRRNYLDVTVTDISAEGLVSYRVKSSEAEFAKIQSELSAFNGAAANSAAFAFKTGPKRGDQVTINEKPTYSRGKVVAIEKPNVVVQYLDTGKVKTFASSSLRPLPTQFSKTPALAKTAKLSFVQQPPASYLEEYVEFLEKELLGKNLVANVDSPAAQNGESDSISLYTANSKGPEDSINALVVDEGYAFVKPQLDAWERADAWKSIREALVELEQGAKSDRVGVWEYGDPRNID